MKEQFADFETAKMLKELGFGEECLMWYDDRKELMFSFTPHKIEYLSAPAYFEIEEWLWENHRINFNMRAEEDVDIFICTPLINRTNRLTLHQSSTSPISSKIEGIKAAVKYLYEQKQQQLKTIIP